VWDVFAAIIHEAQTGIRQPWRTWTPLRKKRQTRGAFLSERKIRLRPIAIHDTDWFIKIYSNSIIMRDIYDGSTLSRDAAIDRVNHFLQIWQAQQFGIWMIIAKDDPSKIIGYCVFRFFEKNNPILDGQIELGYILDQPFWGKGYATQAVQRCIGIGFELHRFNRILATILPKNIASQKVVLKAGMKHISNLPVKNLIHQIDEINKGECI
jgi:[ribosomal protein S5]-alanine N-acetyltransferase